MEFIFISTNWHSKAYFDIFLAYIYYFHIVR